MTDVNNDTVTSDQTPSSSVETEAPVTETAQSSAEMSNTDKVPETVPYGRLSETIAQRNEYKSKYEDLLNQQPTQQSYTQPTQPYQAPTYHQEPVDPLVDQYGNDGANAIRAEVGKVKQELYQREFANEYVKQCNIGAEKYQGEWTKNDYINNGVKGNHIVDLMVKGLTMEEAFRAKSPVNTDAIVQKTKDQTYQEIQNKDASTPASSSAAPTQTGQGHATSVEQAYAQAVEELSRK